MDISGLVDYNFLHTLHVKSPVDPDQDIGIVMQIRSEASDEAKKVLREHLDENLERHVKGKLLKAKKLEEQEIEKAASYIASWDWGSNTYEGKVPELTMANAIRILTKEQWLFGQVVEAARKLGNFSKASPTTSQST